MDLRKRKQSRRRFKHHSSFRFRGPLPAGSVHPPKRLSRLSSSAAPAFLLGYLFVRTHQTNLAPVSAKSDSNIPATAAAPSPAAPAEPILLDRLLITTWLGGGDDLSNRTLGAIKLMTSIRRSGKAPPGTDFGLLVSGLAPLGARAERELRSVGWKLFPAAAGSGSLAKLALWNMTRCRKRAAEIPKNIFLNLCRYLFLNRRGSADCSARACRLGQSAHAPRPAAGRTAAGTTVWCTSTPTPSSWAPSSPSCASTSPPPRSGPHRHAQHVPSRHRGRRRPECGRPAS